MEDGDNERALPARMRRRSRALFPAGAVYFREWGTLRWFVVMTLPVAASALAGAWRKGAITGLGVVILGGAVTTILFVMLASGMSSSNWGTFFRKTEPRAYWVDVVFVGVFYVGACMAGWVLR